MSRLIACEADLEAGVAHLAANHAVWAEIAPQVVPLPLRRFEGGFAGLVRIVIAQQLSVKAAESIRLRVAALVPALDPERFVAADDEALRAAGLSAGKVRTLKAAARAAVAGDIAFDALHAASPEEVHAHLTALPGIGPWTADIYCLFCLGHADGFAAGDLALQEAARVAFSLPDRPKPIAFEALAEEWRPWRGVAARMLWAYYRVIKAREGVTG